MVLPSCASMYSPVLSVRGMTFETVTAPWTAPRMLSAALRLNSSAARCSRPCKRKNLRCILTWELLFCVLNKLNDDSAL